MPSTGIAKKYYYPHTKTLRVIYNSGAIYDYPEVPPEVYAEMENAFSNGIFLNTRIKTVYKYKK